MDQAEKRSLRLGASAALPALGVTLSWLCCLPLALGGLGAGTAALGTVLTPLRPYFTGAALLLLAAAFHHIYRPQACPPGEACAVRRSRLRQQLVLWAITAATVALLTVDRWASWAIYWLL